MAGDHLVQLQLDAVQAFKIKISYCNEKDHVSLQFKPSRVCFFPCCLIFALDECVILVMTSFAATDFEFP